jgi:hypothetical protein
LAIQKAAHVLLAIHVTNRLKKAPLVQKSLSQYGDVIRTRLGLHEIGEGYSSPEGVMILDVVSEPQARRLQKALDKIAGIETKLVIFRH